MYFEVGILDGEVYNGGFHPYFSNSSGSMYGDAVSGLERLDARHALKLLIRAKEILFGATEAPEDQARRWAAMKDYLDADNDAQEWSLELDAISKEYCQDPDKLDVRLTSFAMEKGLVTTFLKEPQSPQS